MKTSTKSVVSTLKADKRYARLQEAFDTAPLYKIPRETLMAEVKNIHELREIRRLNIRDANFVDNLVKANVHDQASRSRLAEITMTCTHVIAKLSAAIEALQQHFMLEYVDHLRQFRTKEERSLVMKIALRKFIRFVEEVTYLKEVASIVINDIDKAAWSLRTSIQALEIHSRREVNI